VVGWENHFLVRGGRQEKKELGKERLPSNRGKKVAAGGRISKGKKRGGKKGWDCSQLSQRGREKGGLFLDKKGPVKNWLCHAARHVSVLGKRDRGGNPFL